MSEKTLQTKLADQVAVDPDDPASVQAATPPDCKATYNCFDHNGVNLLSWEIQEPILLAQANRKPRFYHRILRVLTLRRVVIASILLLCCFPLWMLLDANYRMALYFVRINLGLHEINADPFTTEIGVTDLIMQSANEWGDLGLRIRLFYLLFFFVAVSWLLLIVQIIRRWTFRRAAIATLVAASWLGLFLMHETMTHWAVKRHAIRLLPRVKLATAFLTAQWPDRSCRIPPGLDLIVADQYPDYLMVTGNSGYPLHERIGYGIQRSPEGGIRFKLDAAYDYNLEYHPPGSFPLSYAGSLSGRKNVMLNFHLLEDKWYLVHCSDADYN